MLPFGHSLLALTHVTCDCNIPIFKYKKKAVMLIQIHSFRPDKCVCWEENYFETRPNTESPVYYPIQIKIEARYWMSGLLIIRLDFRVRFFAFSKFEDFVSEFFWFCVFFFWQKKPQTWYISWRFTDIIWYHLIHGSNFICLSLFANDDLDNSLLQYLFSSFFFYSPTKTQKTKFYFISVSYQNLAWIPIKK